MHAMQFQLSYVDSFVRHSTHVSSRPGRRELGSDALDQCSGRGHLNRSDDCDDRAGAAIPFAAAAAAWN